MNVIWRFTILAMVLIYSGSGDEEYGGGDTDALGKEPYQIGPAPTSAQDGHDPLQLVLVLIFS